MSKNNEIACRRLSALAAEMYAHAGCPGASVRLTDDGAFELHEPSPNAFPVQFRTAAECEAAIREAVASFD